MRHSALTLMQSDFSCYKFGNRTKLQSLVLLNIFFSQLLYLSNYFFQ